MKTIGTKRIYFTGSKCSVNRQVKKATDGTYWVKWYGQNVQVAQRDGMEQVTDGWATVQAF